MAITLSTGTVVAIAATYGVSVTMSALTNASEAVATLAAGHGVVVGDFLEVNSGWGRLNQRIVRVKAVSTNDITLEKIDTTSTTFYPAGQGIGNIRRITSWMNLTQVAEINMSGGEQQYYDITALEDVVGKQIPTVRAPISMTITVFYDQTLSWISNVLTADAARIPYGMLMTMANGSKVVANAYWSMQRVPQVATNQALKTSISLSYAAEPMGY